MSLAARFARLRQAHQPAPQPVAAQPIVAQPIVAQPIVAQPAAPQPVRIQRPARQLPAHLAGNIQPGAQEAKRDYRRIAHASNFLITINGNISWRTIADLPTRTKVYNEYSDAIEALSAGLTDGSLLKAHPGDRGKQAPAPKLTKFDSRIEVSNKNGWLHAHCIATYDSRIHVDLAKMKAEVSRYMPSSQKVYVNVRHFQDVSEIIQAYVNKQSTHSAVVPRG
jgi:hypothetical protein